MRPAVFLRHFVVACHHSTFANAVGNSIRTKLKPGTAITSSEPQTLSVQPRSGVRVRTHATTSQLSSERPYEFPHDASIAQVGNLLASFRSKVTNGSRSNSERRRLAACELLGTRVFEWVKQVEAPDRQLATSKDFFLNLSWLLLAEGEERTLVDFLMHEATLLSYLSH
jgi:hypothetical protein